MRSLILVFLGLCYIQQCVLSDDIEVVKIEGTELDTNSPIVKKILVEAEPRFQKLYVRSNLTKSDRFVRFTGEVKNAYFLTPVYKIDAVFAETVCLGLPEKNQTCEIDNSRPNQVVSIETVLKRNRISNTHFAIKKTECFIPGLEECDFTQEEIYDVLDWSQREFNKRLDFEYMTLLTYEDISNVKKTKLGNEEIKYVINTKFVETTCRNPVPADKPCHFKGKRMDVVVEAIVKAGDVKKLEFEIQ
uniref:DUF3794 domain-containing protein n=1 Tax=Panagrellus redivivus TaxID=6233 RepID=A0A7E4UNL5_PANRE